VAWLDFQATKVLADAKGIEALLAKQPADVTLATLLVRLYRDHGKLEDARRVVAQASAANPKDDALWRLSIELTRAAEKKLAAERGKAHFRLARNALERERASAALAELGEGLKADPELANTVGAGAFWLLKALASEKANRRDDALEAYHRVLLVDPNARAALAGLVRMAQALNKAPLALQELRRFTVALGDDAEGLVTAAELYQRLNRPDDAVELAARASQRGPNERAERVLGLVAFQRGDHARALPHLEKAGPDAEALEALVRGCLVLGRLDDARQHAQRAVKTARPTDALRATCDQVPALVLRRETLARELNVPAAKAAAAYSAALDAFVCAEWAQASGQPAARVEGLLATALGKDVEVGPAYALRGLLLLEKGRLAQALADAERALALCPREARAHLVRGRVRLERGAGEALADLEKAAELSQRQDAAVLHWLAAALFQAGRHQDALATQRRAVELRRGEGEYAEQLRRFEKQTLAVGGGS
jgi:tetratricopeptide (TPR) repeat protein